ncbi:MAG: tetratricopeptide repeat protein [Woeseiaceae bacterium]
MRDFITEIRRRNVFKAAVLYIVSAWIIMQIVDVMFPALHLPQWSITLVAALLILLLPLVLIFAWVFEVTPEGIRRTPDLAGDGVEAQPARRRMDWIILAVLALAVTLLIYQLFVGERQLKETAQPPAAIQPAGIPMPRGVKSVAVLPFLNMSSDQDNEFFADGIAEELLNVLVKLGDLRVPSRTSSFSFKNKNASLTDIGRILNVDHVVEGSVRKAGNRIRVTAQLIDLRTDSHLWSETYDHELDDIFAVQDDIARGIAEALEVNLGIGAGERLVTRSTDSMQAYEMYLLAGQLWQLRRREAVVTAETLLRQAIELDANFAQAWERLAAVNLAGSSWSEVNGLEIERAEMAAKQALQLNPSLAQPRAVLASIAAGQRNYAESERLFREAIELEPSDSTSHLWYAILLNGVGRIHDASLEYRLAVALDPLAPIALSWLAAHEMQTGNHSAAVDTALRAADLGYEYGHILAYEALSRLGRLERAETELRAGLKRDGIESGFVDILMDAQRHPSRRQVALDASAAQLSLPDQIHILAGLRAYDELLDRFAGLRGTFLYMSLPVLWERSLVEMRRKPHFKALLQELLLLDYWRDSGRWPDFCRPDGEAIECDVTAFPAS